MSKELYDIYNILLEREYIRLINKKQSLEIKNMENILAQEKVFRGLVSEYSLQSGSAFGDKKNKAAMTRARKQLLLLRKQCNVLRQTIQEYKNSL